MCSRYTALKKGSTRIGKEPHILDRNRKHIHNAFLLSGQHTWCPQLETPQKRSSVFLIRRGKKVRSVTWLQFPGPWRSYTLRHRSKALPAQIWTERGRHRWWSREGTGRLSRLGYRVPTFRLLYSSYFKSCQVPAVSLLSKVLIHLILLKEVGEEEDCSNLTLLWSRRDSHHLGFLSGFRCNILLSVKLCICSFSVALTVTSIFAKHNIKILQT